MGRLQVTISGDGLEARVRVVPGPAATIAELRAALRAAGVVYGIDEPALTRLGERLDDPATEATITAALGVAPCAGTDGELQSDVAGPRLAGTAIGNDRIDFRERQSLRPATAGAVVGTIIPPTAGVAGHDVRGNELASRPGRPHGQRIGAGIRREADQLVATRDGVLLVTDQIIDVVPLYTHAGNVDYASGNLHTPGSLLIQGDIVEGFTATADGDIEVTGTVQGGGAAAGGAVTIAQGVLGGAHTVRAGTDIRCHHATAARMVAGRSIEIGDQINQSHLQAPRIRATEGRGVVRGTALHARDRIEVRQAGCQTGTETILAVGELLDERVELARRTLATAQLQRTTLRQPGRGAKGLRAAVRAGDRERDEQLRVLARQRELLLCATIRITDTCHTGVVLKFGDHELRPNETLGPTTFRFDPDLKTIVPGEL